MATINWAGSTNPVATLRFRSNATTDVEWSGPLIWNAQAGDTIRIRLRFRSTDTMGVHRMRAWVERLDLKGAVVDELRKFEFARDGEYDIIESVDIPLDGQLLRFRVRAQVALSWRLDTGSGQGGPVWADEERRVYTAFVQFYGDFALDYVPITILYCPPGQDMTNAITQSTEYGTVVTLGTTELVGSGAESTSYVRGGVRISTPYVQEGWSHEDGEKTSTSQSVENASRNSVAFGYEWSSTLLADNQRAIGRAYWGPLGDIFVLLRNPWFSLIGNEKGISLVVNADRTAEETELLILPAHKLLRPGDDPVASRISRATRRRLLALDPFITNVDEFLPPSEAQDENINIPLANAAIPYADPSAPAPGGHGLNRAALLARYAISTGIEVDLSSTTNIVVEDQQTNESVYYAERSEVSGLDGTIDLAGFFQQGVGGTAVERTFTRISYQASHETRLRHVNTARCTLIRNQNEADLRDIEVWWDKQFSTFMFRTIEPMAGLVIGVVTDWFHQFLTNVKLDLIAVELAERLGPRPIAPPPFDTNHYSTMTDHRGRFSFRNVLRPGTYELRCGKSTHPIKLDEDAIRSRRPVRVEFKGVRRPLDLRSAAIWELMDALELPKKDVVRFQTALREAGELNSRAVMRLMRRERLPWDRLKESTQLIIR